MYNTVRARHKTTRPLFLPGRHASFRPGEITGRFSSFRWSEREKEREAKETTLGNLTSITTRTAREREIKFFRRILLFVEKYLIRDVECGTERLYKVFNIQYIREINFEKLILIAKVSVKVGIRKY